MAGHSKWAQIKHKKAATDAERGRQFGKLARDITMAARAGGENPDANPRLRSAMDRARAAGMPKDNILRAINRSLGTADNLVEFLLEALAPDEVILLIEGATDNKNRALAEIKAVLAEYDARIADPGSVMWNFSKMILAQAAPVNPATGPEEPELAIIDSGAEDFSPSETGWTVRIPFADAETIKRNLIERGFSVQPVGYTYAPRAVKQVAPDVRERIKRLINALRKNENVQSIHTNLAFDRQSPDHLGD